MGGMGEVTKAILARAGRDEKFRKELIEKMEERARKAKAQLVTLEKALRAVKKLKQ